MRLNECTDFLSKPSIQNAAVAAEPPSAARRREPGRIVVLDGLRGLAALSVALIHYSLGPSLRFPSIYRVAALLEMSPISLDNFLILSGFLIGNTLLRTKDSPTYYRSFYRHRFLRILPLYYVWIALFCFLYFVGQGWGLEPPAHFSGAFYLFSFVLFFQNFFPSIIESAVFVSPTWTLAVEQHFYLLAPVVVRRLSPRRLVHFLVAVIVAAPILRGVLFQFVGHRAEWADIATRVWTPCRADALALGLLLAILWQSLQHREWMQNHASLFGWGVFAGSLVGMSLEYVATANSPHYQLFNAIVGRSAVELASFSLIVYLLCRPQSAFARLVSTDFLSEMGKVSYCFYVIHWGVLWMIFRFVLHRGFGQHLRLDLTVAPLALLLSIAIARISWKYFEYPLIRKSHSTTRPDSKNQLTALDRDSLRSLAQVK